MQIKTAICKCGNEYEPIFARVFGRDIQITYMCDECRKRELADYEAKQEAQLTAEIAHKRRQWRESCGIPPKFMTSEFGNFDTSRPGNVGKIHKAFLDYAENYPLNNPIGYQSILVFGDNGLGKSHLACAVGHHILNRWNGENITNPILFVSEPDMLNSIQATFNYDYEEKQYRESADDIIRRMTSVRLLILDEIGKEKRSDPKFVQRTLFRIIDARYKYQLPMVLTTNLNLEQLERYLSANSDEVGSFDRLWEMCGNFWKIEGESYRRKEYE